MKAHLILLASSMTLACGSSGKDENGNGDGDGTGIWTDGYVTVGGGGPGAYGTGGAFEVEVDVSGAHGLFIVGDEAGAALSGSSSSSRELVGKLDGDGNASPAMTIHGGPYGEYLPRVATMAVSPLGEIFLHFEHPWSHRAATPGSDPSDMRNGALCQIFMVKDGGLACVDDQHFIDAWYADRKSVFQFDEAGNLYYPGSLPGGLGKMVVYKRDAATGALGEVINANICVQDFAVTRRGGVFYTGVTDCTGVNGSMRGFFRYVRPDDARGLIEIGHDWLNFVFHAYEGAEEDQALFWGPNPSAAAGSTRECLFRYDPAQPLGERVTALLDCNAPSAYAWVTMTTPAAIATYGVGYESGNIDPSNVWRAEFARRCTATDVVLGVAGTPVIKQDGKGGVYVAGQLRRKKAGTLVDEGLRCVMPDDDGGANWEENVDGVAKLDPTTRMLVLVSDPAERVERLWIADGAAFVASYSPVAQTYVLKRLDPETGETYTVREQLEVYSLTDRCGMGMYFDGLDFATNTYGVGTIDGEAPYETKMRRAITGVVKTIVQMPSCGQ